MNHVLFRAEEVPLPSWTKAADAFISHVLDSLGLENWELSILFCNNKYIKSLNAQYRDKDEATDVLSFPIGETLPEGKSGAEIYVAGDIVISLDALGENARFFKVSEDEELRRLLIHGILHLSGADHATNDKEEPMLKRQEEILEHLNRNKQALIMEQATEEYQ
jgi:probable rRNA maturation factor